MQPVLCRVCLGGEGAGRRRLGHISMTPVTEPLWVFKRLPRDSWAPLRLLLITPDLVKPPDLKHSARDCQLNLTLCVSGLLGMILFCSLVLAFSYICLFFLGPYCVYDWMPRWTVLPTLLSCELQACSRWISHATCHAFSHLLSAVVFSLQFST